MCRKIRNRRVVMYLKITTFQLGRSTEKLEHDQKNLSSKDHGTCSTQRNDMMGSFGWTRVFISPLELLKQILPPPMIVPRSFDSMKCCFNGQLRGVGAQRWSKSFYDRQPSTYIYIYIPIFIYIRLYINTTSHQRNSLLSGPRLQ